MDPFTLALMGSVGSSVLGGFLGSNAEEEAARARAESIAQAAEERDQGYVGQRRDLTRGYNTARQDLGRGYTNALRSLGPQRWDATNALYSDLVAGGFDGYQERLAAGFEADPGYQFRLQQGEEALARAHNAGQGPGLRSGAYDKALADYSQGLASQEYGNYVGRNQDYLGRLYGVAGMEQQRGRDRSGLYVDRGNNQANLAFQQGQMLGNNTLGRADAAAEALYGQGMARADGEVASANQWVNALGNVSQAFGSFAGNQSGMGGGGSGWSWR